MQFIKQGNTRRGQTQKDVVVIKSVSFPRTVIGNLRHTKPLSLSIKSHSRGWGGPQGSGIFHACRCNKEEKALFNNGYVEDPRQRHSGMTAYFITAWGFTLIELLVAIMIIGILAAVAVPQYQKAVMKSRFAAMMPIAKTLANANEVYYAEHDEYSTDPAKLNVTPQAGTPDGTAINMYSNPEEVSFVRVENPGVPNARYVVYQKLSENFPETTWCEAGDTRAEELCVALGGTLPDGLTGNSSGDNTNYKAYLLTGQARSGDTFAIPCSGAACDEQGNITECTSGKTLNNGSCEDCATAFPGAATCSATSYAPTTCGEGYTLNATGTACEPVPTTCGGVTQPADMVLDSGITGTTSCVDGQWVWQWTGEKEINSNCSAGDTTTCSNAIYGPEMKYCYGRTANGCANSVFTGQSYCYGNTANGCSNSVFLGNNGCFSEYAQGVCTNSTFLSARGCEGYHSGDCAGSKFYPGSRCAALAPSACDGTKYAFDENGNIGYCSISSYQGKTGTCPTGVPLNNTGTSWQGGYCNPNFMVSGTCPAGSPKQGGGTW